MAQEGTRVNASTLKVKMVKPKLETVFSKGWNRRIAAAAIRPALAALIPSNDALIGRNFFNDSQTRIRKKGPTSPRL
jgi:hypothetical protein